MLIIRIVIFLLLSLGTIVTFAINTKRWSDQFRQYMIEQANQAFGSPAGWERPWTVFLSKAMVVFFGAMLVILFFVVCFTQSP